MQKPLDPKTVPRLPSLLPSEEYIEKKVCDYARSQGVLCYKFASPGHRSVPDRIFLFSGGKVIFIEFKKPKRKPTERQAQEIEKIRQKQISVYVVDDVEKGIGIISWHLGRY